MTPKSGPPSRALQDMLDLAGPLIGPSILYRILNAQVPSFAAVRKRAEVMVSPLGEQLQARVVKTLSLAAQNAGLPAIFEAFQQLGEGAEMEQHWQVLQQAYAAITEPLGSPPCLPFVMWEDLLRRIWAKAHADPQAASWLDSDAGALAGTFIMGMMHENFDEIAGLPKGSVWYGGEPALGRAAAKVAKQMKAAFTRHDPVEAVSYWAAIHVFGVRIDQLAQQVSKSEERVRSQVRLGAKLLQVQRRPGRPKKGTPLPPQIWEATTFKNVVRKEGLAAP